MDRAGVFIGLILAGVIALGVYLAPKSLPSISATVRAADEQATLATRRLFRYAQNLSAVKRLGDLPNLQQADLSSVVTHSSGDSQPKTVWDVLRDQFETTVQSLRRADTTRERTGLEPSNVRAPALDGSGLQASVQAMLKWIEDNDKLLREAESAAVVAAAASSDIPGASQPLGIAKLIRAAEALDAAAEFRRHADARRSALLTAVVEFKLATAEATNLAERDTTKVAAKLREELDKLNEQKSTVDAELARVTAARNERVAQLAELKTKLDASRDALLKLETAGFKAGNDASFEAYRSQYRTLSETLAGLQAQLDQWELGGLSGATFGDDDPARGEIQGGEAVIGLDQLTGELAVAEAMAGQLAGAVDTLQARIDALNAAGQGDAARRQRSADAATAARARIDALLKEIDGLIDEAMKLEASAIVLAQAAAKAFHTSTDSTERWISAARALKSEMDQANTNERLKRISNDNFAKLSGPSGEVAARLLEARVHAQRVRAIEAHLRMLEEMQVAIPGAEIKNKAEIEAFIQTARDAGTATLEEAKKLCEELVRGPANVQWIAQGLLAATHFVWAQVDAARSDAHRADAQTALDAAVEKRERSPYVQALLRWRDQMKGTEETTE